MKHQIKFQGRLVINWAVVSQHLNRPEQECREKWQYICASRVKKGPYKQEEDDIIIVRIKEHMESTGSETIGNELWEALEKELGRPAKNIRLRWKAGGVTKKGETAAGAVAVSSSGGNSSSSSGTSSNITKLDRTDDVKGEVSFEEENREV